MNVENIYARSEAHAISDSRGDISRLIIFNNNAEKTVFEFIDEADMAMLGWGTSKQRASLLSQHLSEEIKSRTAEFSDNFSRIREWLIKTYGRADRIIGDISAGLKAQPKPSNAIPSTSADKGERYTYFANICTAIARFDKLAKIPDIQIEELNAVMYCRSTVAGLIDLLPGSDQDQLRRKMTERTLDWDNPKVVQHTPCSKSIARRREISSLHSGGWRVNPNPNPNPYSYPEQRRRETPIKRVQQGSTLQRIPHQLHSTPQE